MELLKDYDLYTPMQWQLSLLITFIHNAVYGYGIVVFELFINLQQYILTTVNKHQGQWRIQNLKAQIIRMRICWTVSAFRAFYLIISNTVICCVASSVLKCSFRCGRLHNDSC